MFDNLKNSVSGITDTVKAAIALIGGLHQKLVEAIAADDESGENTAVQALADQLDSAKADLAAAILANTVADPAAAGSTGSTDTGATSSASGAGGGIPASVDGGAPGTGGPANTGGSASASGDRTLAGS